MQEEEEEEEEEAAMRGPVSSALCEDALTSLFRSEFHPPLSRQ